MKKIYSILVSFLFFCLGISLPAQELESSLEISIQETTTSRNELGTQIDYSDPNGIGIYDDLGNLIGYKEGHQ